MMLKIAKYGTMGLLEFGNHLTRTVEDIKHICETMVMLMMMLITSLTLLLLLCTPKNLSYLFYI